MWDGYTQTAAFAIASGNRALSTRPVNTTCAASSGGMQPRSHSVYDPPVMALRESGPITHSRAPGTASTICGIARISCRMPFFSATVPTNRTVRPSESVAGRGENSDVSTGFGSTSTASGFSRSSSQVFAAA
jgi:hypothetical protein